MNSKPRSLGRSLSATRTHGFTLIEVMITVVIVGILAAIALPSYNEYVQRSHRANAQVALIQTSQWLERSITAQGVYPLAPLPAGLTRVEGGRYSVTYVVSANQSTYTLTASPSAPAQTADRCGGFRVNERGNRTVTGTAPINECWTR